jgi:hypothetical protein
MMRLRNTNVNTYSYDSVRFILLKIGNEWVINYRYSILCHFLIVGAEAVGTESRYGSSSATLVNIMHRKSNKII